MSLVTAVRAKMAQNKIVEDPVNNEKALREAARLADLYSDIRPEPFVVPIERFVGLPILGESKIER